MDKITDKEEQDYLQYTWDSVMLSNKDFTKALSKAHKMGFHHHQNPKFYNKAIAHHKKLWEDKQKREAVL